MTAEIVDYLCTFFRHCNSTEIPINSTEVINETMKLDESLKEHTYSALHKFFIGLYIEMVFLYVK